MQQTITINLTPEGNLQLPRELRDRFSIGEEYLVTTTEDTITFSKAPKLSWEELRQRRNVLEDEPDALSTEEICEIVKEVRKEASR
ncbi:hypothetical protein H6F42_11150 [Pseudanabaena sp. FACHB-1998]|uniref:hypothetical protein n=1 Tax=Pseudanabaena sp. FACHB-1998 TaxID=2692858 RepID=UPI001681B881|nr:hypothetical protein [Pseudanabaena sp. FACHB-1998]MBD2177469.1 hypothetical protein [Pseudanabaena sp. FACHB-1998]